MFIRELVNQVYEGRVRIPVFQRGFVWDADRVAQLMDSIYKGYPFGSLLFWRTKQELKSERTLGPFSLPNRPDDFPVDYVLDGQQRLTSIFGVFQTALNRGDDSADWMDIYFDMRSSSDVQDSMFEALPVSEADPSRYFPLRTLYDSGAFGSAVRALPPSDATVIDELWTRFKECDVPVQTFSTDDRTGVAIVFERVNRLGVELDTLQLLSAWTWSDDFYLEEQFRALADEFGAFGFREVGEDITLLLRCCAAVVEGDPSPSTLMQLNGNTVRDQFPHIVNGLRGAIDFVRNELSIQKLENLPYSTLLVPLTVFFAAPDGKSVKVSPSQREKLLRWFWRACFGGRYGRVVQRNLKVDAQEALKLRQNASSRLDEIPTTLDQEFFIEHRFSMNSVASKTYILLLAQQGPRTLVGGGKISLADVLSHYNRKEFHHLYPQKFLRAKGVPVSRQSALANMCFINSTDNKTLGGDAPSVYRSRLATGSANALSSALVPEDELFSDDYDSFVEARSKVLFAAAQRLLR